jgi:hypothetical protein
MQDKPAAGFQDWAHIVSKLTYRFARERVAVAFFGVTKAILPQEGEFGQAADARAHLPGD